MADMEIINETALKLTMDDVYGVGVDDYEALSNKPKINNVEVSGSKSLDDYGIVSKDDISAAKKTIDDHISDTSNPHNVTAEQLNLAAFVTPEMYGAVGDGKTDDTHAFQMAVNKSDTLVLTCGKSYVLTGDIDAKTKTRLYIDGNFASICGGTFIVNSNDTVTDWRHSYSTESVFIRNVTIRPHNPSGANTFNAVEREIDYRPFIISGSGIRLENIRVVNRPNVVALFDEYIDQVEWRKVSATLNPDALDKSKCIVAQGVIDKTGANVAYTEGSAGDGYVFASVNEFNIKDLPGYCLIQPKNKQCLFEGCIQNYIILHGNGETLFNSCHFESHSSVTVASDAKEQRMSITFVSCFFYAQTPLPQVATYIGCVWNRSEYLENITGMKTLPSSKSKYISCRDNYHAFDNYTNPKWKSNIKSTYWIEHFDFNIEQNSFQDTVVENGDVSVTVIVSLNEYVDTCKRIVTKSATVSKQFTLAFNNARNLYMHIYVTHTDGTITHHMLYSENAYSMKVAFIGYYAYLVEVEGTKPDLALYPSVSLPTEIVASVPSPSVISQLSRYGSIYDAS